MSPSTPVLHHRRQAAGTPAADVRYAALVDQMVDGLFVADAAGRYIDVNRAGCELLGYSRDELLRMSIPDVVDREEIARVRPEVERLSGGGIVSSEWRFRRKDGTVFLGEVVGRQLPDGRLQAILRDITARKSGQDRLARLSKAYATRSEINKCVARATDENDLLLGTCRVAIGHAGFRHARIVPLDDDDPLSLPAVHCGPGAEAGGRAESPAGPGHAAQREALRRALAERGRYGPVAPSADPLLGPGCDACALCGAAMAFPLAKENRLAGAIVFYAEEAASFEEETIRLLDEIAADVSFGLGSLAERRRVAENELRFATIFRTSPDCILIVRMADDTVVDVNDAFLRTFGYTREQVVGQSVPAIALWQSEAAQLAMLSMVERDGRVKELEAVWRRRSGEARDCLVSGEIILLDGVRHISCVVTDVTERREIDRLLYAREQEFAALAENSPDIISRFDRKARRTYANRELSRCFGIPLEQVLGKTPTEGMPGSVVARQVEDAVEQVIATAHETELDVAANEGADGRTVHRHIRIVPEFDTKGRVTSALAIARDITRLKETKQRLRETQEQLRQLDARREHAREDERKRIAREIHDELGQMLTALRLDVDMLGMDFGSRQPALRERTAKTMRLVDETIAVVRNLASSLRPPVLEMGVVSALEWLGRETAGRSSVVCEVSARESEVDLDETTAIEVFRIAQESLTNVARHARARKATIALRRTADGYELAIADDGAGFDPQSVGHSSLGLVGMRERAAGIGGELEVTSAPGVGTRIVARWPGNQGKEPS